MTMAPKLAQSQAGSFWRDQVGASERRRKQIAGNYGGTSSLECLEREMRRKEEGQGTDDEGQDGRGKAACKLKENPEV